jgi:hypothetical protein
MLDIESKEYTTCMEISYGLTRNFNLVVILSWSATRYCDSQSRENVCEHGGEHASGLHGHTDTHKVQRAV